MSKKNDAEINNETSFQSNDNEKDWGGSSRNTVNFVHSTDAIDCDDGRRKCRVLYRFSKTNVDDVSIRSTRLWPTTIRKPPSSL